MDDKVISFESNFSVLDRYGEDVTAHSFVTNPAIGREEQIKELILILLTPEKSAILIGKPGVGKTAIVEGLAYRIQHNDVPDSLKGYTIINIKTASLLGTMPSGESKVQKMIDELKEREKVILFIDEIHMLIGTTDSSSLDFANIFKEGLGRGSIKVVGATTTEEYERYILRDKAFTRRFQKVEVSEPTREETVKIMMGTLPKFEKQTNRKMKYTPFIKERIMEFLVDITSEYKRIFALGSRYPDVCLTLLKQAFSYTAYDDREYMDIFDIRKAIENSKNIYPDVIKKELPRFDKEFHDIMLEERGEKPIEEWRREVGPTRYEQEAKNRVVSEFLDDKENLSREDELLSKLNSIPSMVSKENLKNIKPVKSILSEKTLNRFAKIGPTAISRGFKEKFNQKSDSKNIDDLLLSSKIAVISDKNDSNSIPFQYTVTDELKPGGTTSLLLGSPIASTLDDEIDHKEDKMMTYKSDNATEKELDPNSHSLILDNLGNDYSKKNKFFDDTGYAQGVDENLKFFEKTNSSDLEEPSFDHSSIDSVSTTGGTRPDPRGDFLFGAPMYDTKKDSDSKSEKTTDIFGQILTSDNMMIRGGKIVDDAYFLKKPEKTADNVEGSDNKQKVQVDDFLAANHHSIGNESNFHSANNDYQDESVSNHVNSFPNRKWKFLQDFEDDSTSSKPQEFNELKIPSNVNSDEKKDENQFSIADNMKKSSDFINFSDLNSGKISSVDVDKFISLSNSKVEDKDVSSFNGNTVYSTTEEHVPLNNQVVNSSLPDLKLEEKDDSEDNFFDDFFDD